MARKKTPPVETAAERRQRYMTELCEMTADTDWGIKRICDHLRSKNPDFPPARTIRGWMDEDADLAAQYARAKDCQLWKLSDDIIEIADDDSDDAIFIGSDDESGESARRVMNSEFVQRSKLRVDARKWVLSKLMPKVFGDKITNEHTGDGGGPMVIEVVKFGQNTPT